MACDALFGLGIGFGYSQATKKPSSAESVFYLSKLTVYVLSKNRTGKIVYIADTVLLLAEMFFQYQRSKPENPEQKEGLPQPLNPSRVRSFSVLSGITNTALLVGIIALPFFGYGYVAAGIVVPIAFEGLKSADLLPLRITRIAERCMRIADPIYSLFNDSIFLKINSFFLLTAEMPELSGWVQKKIESMFNSKIDAPWEKKENLTYKEILHILKTRDLNQYEIHIPHCSKSVAEKTVSDDPEDDEESIQSYESKILLKLQSLRQTIMEETYEKLDASADRNLSRIEHFTSAKSDAGTPRYLAWDFYPLSENDQRQLGLQDVLFSWICKEDRGEMYEEYQEQLNDVFKNDERNAFLEYFDKKIKTLALDHTQKTQLRDQLSELSPNLSAQNFFQTINLNSLRGRAASCFIHYYSLEDFQHSLEDFQRLFFVMQGVLELKAQV